MERASVALRHRGASRSQACHARVEATEDPPPGPSWGAVLLALLLGVVLGGLAF